MSSATPYLSLPLLMPAQAQKHITMNESLLRLDRLVHLMVETIRDMPPETPQDGVRYIIGNNPQSEWAERLNDIAEFKDGGWTFLTPKDGWRCYIKDIGRLQVYSSNSWQDLSSETVESLSLLGINTVADTHNKFALKSDSLLFSHDDVTPGSGDIRAVFNKKDEGATAACLFQSDWSGRAEMGLTGDNRFQIKVSDTGATWKQALVIDPDTGIARFPQGGVRPQLTADQSLYVNAATGSDENSGHSETEAFATINKAVMTVIATDLGGYEMTINVADGSYEESLTLLPLVGGRCTLRGNLNSPDNVVVASPVNSNLNCINATGLSEQWHLEGFRLSGTRVGIECSGYISFRDMTFATSFIHLRANFGGTILINGDYAIEGPAKEHIRVANGARVIGFLKTVTLRNTPHFSTSFVQAGDDGFLRCNNFIWVGSATGKRYTANSFGRINTDGGGETYFPGDISGTLATAGQYE